MAGAPSRWRAQHAWSLLAVLVTATALSGCVEQLPEVQAKAGDVRNAIARGQLTSPKAATVALVSLEGAPADVEARFRQSLSAQAASREIVITDAASARYLVRAYLSAYPGEQGVTVAYTYDVFDGGDKRRRQRVADTMDVPSAGGDPWSAVTEPVLSSLVGRSTDDLAVALAGTPEAQAATGQATAGQSTAGKVAAAAPETPAPVN